MSSSSSLLLSSITLLRHLMQQSSPPLSLADQVRNALRPIPQTPTSTEIPAVTEVYVARVAPESVGPLVKALATLIPLQQNLRHVKRVRRRHLAPSPVEAPARPHPTTNSTSTTVTATSPIVELDVLLAPADAWPPTSPHIASALAQFNLYPRRERVPTHAPVTREEFATGGNFWPLHFRPTTPPKSPPSPAHLASMLRYARRAISLARDAIPVVCAPAAILVDSDANVVRAEATDHSDPMSIHPYTRLRHAVMECIAAVAERNAAAAGGAASEDGSPTEAAYLCTGLDAFLSGEPCTMCAMALVHSRIRRAVYVDNLVDGVGGLSKAQIHRERALNHRYDAFQLPRSFVESCQFP